MKIVECSNIGSCGYGVKDKLIVYPLFDAQYRFIKDLQEQLEKCRKFAADDMSDYVKLKAELEQKDKESNRLLVLATKHCPIEHHDFGEIKKIAKLKGSF